MKRCVKCLYPDTRPDIHFDEHGVCSACNEHEARKSIDWGERLEALKALLNTHLDIPYHCVVPVSGGKDSTYQVLKLQELGARVLAVHAATDYQSPIGRRNLDNLKNYVDLVEVTPCLRVRKALVRIGLSVVGDMSWPEHVAIWSIPTRIALERSIPLVVWGEQPQRAYACPDGVVPATTLDSRWVAEFGGLLGMRLDDVIGLEGLTGYDLECFRFPADEDLDWALVRGIWLGDYVPWNGMKNAFIAQAHGFETLPHNVEGSIAPWENLDNYVTVLRDYLRYRKYGYTRATDILCSQIRHGFITKEEALKLEELSCTFPATSLGKPIAEVLGYFGLTVDEFKSECEQWDSPHGLSRQS